MNEVLYIKQLLQKSLANLPQFRECILLDYPDYLNLGDHLIWLGCIVYLTQIASMQVRYVASPATFSDDELMKASTKDVPIFFSGGGNLGDIWDRSQAFREKIISHYHDRPIIIFPQSIYFKEVQNIIKAANIFNQHPDLTIFIRDDRSYEIAQKYFSNCKLLRAPDMAFQLLGYLQDLDKSQIVGDSENYLYLCRHDRELNPQFLPKCLGLSNVEVADWPSFQWTLGINKNHPLKLLATLLREGWQRGIRTPKEYVVRAQWLRPRLKALPLDLLDNPEIHKLSLSFIHSAIYQLQKYKCVITNRLHGHILCTLLGIPHIFLPGSYHKNEAFYQTWTTRIEFCRFVKDAEQVNAVVQEILESSSQENLV